MLLHVLSDSRAQFGQCNAKAGYHSCAQSRRRVLAGGQQAATKETQPGISRVIVEIPWYVALAICMGTAP